MHDLIWRCHDGRRLKVGEIDLRHLHNCINMIRRGFDAQGRVVTRKTAAALPRLLLELDIRNLKNYDNNLWC